MREQQLLALELLLDERSAQAFEQDALVRCVLVEQEQTRLALEDEIQGERLTDVAQALEHDAPRRRRRDVRSERRVGGGISSSSEEALVRGRCPARAGSVGANGASGRSAAPARTAAPIARRNRSVTARGSRKRTSHFAGWTFTSTSS